MKDSIHLQKKATPVSVSSLLPTHSFDHTSDQFVSSPSNDFSQLNIHDPAGSAPPPIQTKLSIGQPNDRYEQEADQVADQVVQNQSTPSLQKQEEEGEAQVEEGTTPEAVGETPTTAGEATETNNEGEVASAEQETEES